MNNSHKRLMFNCIDCGDGCVRFWMFDGEPERCFECKIIREAAPEDRHELRTRIYTLRQHEYWAQVGCYRDESMPERRCDHCDKPYRGPGVFCCQRCALAEAI